jgi:hypothetical protein
MQKENINFYLARLLYQREVGSKWFRMISNGVISGQRYETVASVKGKPLARFRGADKSLARPGRKQATVTRF